MALFGGTRDIDTLRGFNVEVLGNIINQQCSFYKYDSLKTKTNIYGEVSGDRFFIGPILFNCLIEHQDQETQDSDLGNSTTQKVNFAFLKDDLINSNIKGESGDIILYNDSYYEVDNVKDNQFAFGKNPNYPNELQQLNPGLGNFGWDLSIICESHIVPSDRLGITIERI